MGAREGRGAGRGLDGTLYELVDGLRAVQSLSPRYLPDTARILVALRQPEDLAWEGISRREDGATEGIEPAAPLFPRVDSPPPPLT